MRLKVIFNCNLPILEESLFLNLSAIANKSAGVYIEIKRVSCKLRGGGGGAVKTWVKKSLLCWLELRNLLSQNIEEFLVTQQGCQHLYLMDSSILVIGDFCCIPASYIKNIQHPEIITYCQHLYNAEMDKKSQNFLLFTRNTISVDFSPYIIDTKEDFCLLCLWIDFFSLSPFLLEFLLCVYKDVPAMKRWWVCSIYWTGALSEEVKDSGCTWLIPVQNRYLITCSLAIQRNRWIVW